MEKLVIIGSGMAGGKLVEELVNLNASFEITIVGEEPYGNYDRIKLTSLLIEDDIEDFWLNSEEWYKNNKIKTVLAQKVIKIDRKNKNIWGVSIPSKDADTVTRAITETLGELPNDYIKTITFDNGTEFSMHKEIENALSCKVYFADPYCSWQRGLNEHINARIRQYLPKKKSFANLTDDQFDSILYAINNRPRKILGWKSSYEVFLNDICCT